MVLNTYDYLRGLAEGLGIKGSGSLDVLDVGALDRGSVEAFKKFVKCFDVECDFMMKHFKGLGDWNCFTQQRPLYDHARLVRTSDDKNILILQPYLKPEDCYRSLASWGIKNEYHVSKSLSFHNPEGTCLIAIYEDGKTMI